MATLAQNLNSLVNSAQQSSAAVSMQDDIFRLQLGRNSFTNTNTTFTLAVAGAGASDTCIGAINWMEIT